MYQSPFSVTIARGTNADCLGFLPVKLLRLRSPFRLGLSGADQKNRTGSRFLFDRTIHVSGDAACDDTL